MGVVLAFLLFLAGPQYDLVTAAGLGRIEVVRALLDSGLPVDGADSNGDSLLLARGARAPWTWSRSCCDGARTAAHATTRGATPSRRSSTAWRGRARRWSTAAARAR